MGEWNVEHERNVTYADLLLGSRHHTGDVFNLYQNLFCTLCSPHFTEEKIGARRACPGPLRDLLN